MNAYTAVIRTHMRTEGAKAHLQIVGTEPMCGA
jgi:hypothetical protein